MSGFAVSISPSGAIGGPVAVAVVMHRVCGLSPSAKLVVSAIAKRTRTAEPDAGAWPSMALLRSETGRSLPTIRRAIAEAIAAGWLRVTRESTERLSRCYVVTVPPSLVGPLLAANDIEADDAVSPPEGEHPSTDATRGRGNTMFPQGESYVPSEGKPCSPRGNTTFPEYIREDSREDPKEDQRGDDARTALPPSVPAPFKLELSEPAPIPEAKSEKSTRAKGSTIPKAPKAPKSPTLAAWGEGIQRVTGAPWVSTDAGAAMSLSTIVSTYAPRGTSGEALTAWLADSAERYARSDSDGFERKQGFSPKRALKWFAGGSPTTATTPKPNGFPVRAHGSQPADPTNPTASHVVYEPLDNAAE